MDACQRCNNYAAEALGLCGSCLKDDGRNIEDLDAFLRERKRIRSTESHWKQDSPKMEVTIPIGDIARATVELLLAQKPSLWQCIKFWLFMKSYGTLDEFGVLHGK